MSLHWFPFYHADYLADTGRLSAAQHGVYLLLLLSFFKDGPLPNDPDTLCRIAAGATPSDVNAILQRYWVLTDDGWVQPKMEKVRQDCLSRDEANAARALAGAKARWEQKSLENASSIPSSNASSIPRSNAPRNAPGNAHLTSHNSQPTSQKDAPIGALSPDVPSGRPRDTCPHQEIIALYHKHLPGSPRVRSWDGERPKLLRARWRDHPDLGWWDGFLGYVAESKRLTGREFDRRGPFFPTLDWLIRPRNFALVTEGVFHK